MAARSLLNTVRELFPTLLNRKDRGKGHDEEARPTAFGALPTVSDISGADLLAAQAQLEGRDFAAGGGAADWEDDGAESDSSGWEEVEELEDGREAPEEEGDLEPRWMRRQRLRDARQKAASGAGGDGDDDDEEEGDASDDDGGEEEEAGSDAEEEEEDVALEGSAAAAAGSGDAALPLGAVRLLTPADFAQIKALRTAAASKLRRGKKRSREESEGGPDIEEVVSTAIKAAAANSDAIVGFNPDAIESASALKRRAQAERALEVQRTKTQKWSPGARRGGSTNEEKLRGKNFMMLKKSREVQAKVKSSLRAQQKAVRKHLHRQANLISHDKRKRRRS